MKRTYLRIKIFSLAASSLMLLASSCARNDLEGTMRRSNEVKIAATVGGPVVTEGTKSAFAAEIREEQESQVYELRSVDGSVVIPMSVTVSEGLPQTGIVSTKGTYINGPHAAGEAVENKPLKDYVGDPYFLTSFTMSAYYTDNYSDFVPANSTVTWDTGNDKWALDRTYYWPQATGIDFYAYANKPESDAITITVDKVNKKQTLTYVVPDNTRNQKDILMGVYSGSGNTNGEAEILFRHPLTSVQFRRSPASPELQAVTQITMGGVHYSGSVDQTMEKTSFGQWTVSDKEETVIQDNNGLPFEVHGEIDGDPFLLIPQLEQEKSKTHIELTVILIIDGHEIPLNSVLENVVWDPGKTYTYTIGYVGSVKSSITMTSVSETEKAYPIITNTGSKKIYVRATAVGYFTNEEDDSIKRTWLNDDGTNRGTFTVSSGTFGEGTWNTYWKAGTDGFWYYTKPLNWAGSEQTTPLFDNYSITGLNSGENFELLISEQAVEWDNQKKFVKETWGEYAAGLLE